MVTRFILLSVLIPLLVGAGCTAVPDPTPELMIYDLETDTFLPPLTAVPFIPLWSPDSTRLVFQHPTDGLSIFGLRTQTAYPLATSGSERFSNPQ